MSAVPPGAQALKPSVVVRRRGQRMGVLVDSGSYQDLRREILLLRLLAQGESDIRAGRRMSQEQVFKSQHTRLATRRRREPGHVTRKVPPA